MKKIFILVCLAALPLSVFASDGCATGYACLLSDLNDRSSVIQEIERERIQKYYDPTPLAVWDKDKSKANLKDLLPLHPRFNIMTEE